MNNFRSGTDAGFARAENSQPIAEQERTKMRAHAPDGGINAMKLDRSTASLPEIADRVAITNNSLDGLHVHLDELLASITGQGEDPRPGTELLSRPVIAPMQRIDDTTMDNMHRVQHAIEKIVRIRGTLFG